MSELSDVVGSSGDGSSGTSADARLLERTRDEMFFIVGAGRSGTTLLQSVLMAGDEIVIPMEPKFFGAYPTGRASVGRPDDEAGFEEFLRRIHAHQEGRGIRCEFERFAALAQQSERTWGGVLNALLATVSEEAGGKRVGEKSPVHTFHVGELAEAFPKAKFVHMLRDPRAVVLSRIRSGFAQRRIAPAAELWTGAAEMHRAHAERLGEERYFIVRYESLVQEPEATIRGVCGFLGLTFSEAMLAHHQSSRHPGGLDAQKHHQNLRAPLSTASLEKWRTQLTADQLRLTEGMLWDEMEMLGYEPSGERAPAGWVEGHARRSETAARLEAPVLRVMRRLRGG